jgi:Na+-translocating ferredoxin:NAD+ oxidoreductase RnfG subunit
MFKLYLLVISIWFTGSSFQPKDLDFEDKSLRKEMIKFSGTDLSEWKEVSIADRSDAIHVQGKYFERIEPSGLKKYIYVGRVNSCRQGGCSNPVQSMSIETPEYFDYLVVFDANLLVEQVKVYNYQATHGQEITNKGWLKQFQGYDGNRTLTVGKSIDAISGATVSVQGITSDIQEKTRLLKQIIHQ